MEQSLTSNQGRLPQPVSFDKRQILMEQVRPTDQSMGGF